MAWEQDPGWQFLRLSVDKMMEAQNKKYDSKRNCWIPDAEEGFVPGEITGSQGDKVTVVSETGQEQTLKKDQVQEMNPPKFEKTEDMSNLTFLNEASVLHNLRARYSAMLIYTYSGLFCVVINPYKRLPIYTDSMARIFMGKRRNEMPPHLFAVSDEAYRNMLQDRENQSMLITGESGAGKTENTKKVISYFASVGASQAAAGAKAGGGSGGGATLEEQIVRTNPVLEAFGNAKTVRNNNSSRFGKFIRSHFSGQGKLAGADIEHYLLEKSRVIRQAPGERCYHIFYQIMTGEVKGLKEKLYLTEDMRYYHFVSQAELTIDGIDDNEEAKMTDESFDVMGFSQDEKDNLYKLCAFIMHMGEMKFKQRPREEQAETDGTQDAENACALIGVETEDYLKAILKPRVKVGTEWVNKGQNLEQVKWSMGAMAKGIYARMFHWLINRCNKTLDAKAIQRDFFIGVLDIAGFEIFDFNSFEQLWINFVNERLQQFFNHHMFVLEQEEYTREGIKWETIDFGMDLAACIELIEKPMGIISMLDEECIVPKATDSTLAQKLNDQHLGKHPNFQKPKPPKGKQAEAHFAIVHYAGTVRYNVTAWLEKNKDPLNDTCVAVMKASKDNQLLRDVWADYQTQEDMADPKKAPAAGGKKKGKSGAFQTVSMLYREGLNSLMGMLHQTHPHFVRCIIPNELKRSGLIDAALVLNQLTCNGVLEGIRICRKGFPNRLQYPDFRHRYAIVAPDQAKSSEDVKASSEAIVKQLYAQGVLTGDQAQIGHTKVFFRAGVLANLEDLRDECLSKIMTKLQCQVRWWLARAQYIKREEQKTGIMILQSNIRSWCTLRTWPWFKLYGRVKPLLKLGKDKEELDQLKSQIMELEARLAIEQAQNVKLVKEWTLLTQELKAEKEKLAQSERQCAELTTQKARLEAELEDTTNKLHNSEEKCDGLTKEKRRLETEIEGHKKNIQDLEGQIRKKDGEIQTRDQQIRGHLDEIARQEDVIAKLSKDKKNQEDANAKLSEEILAEQGKVSSLQKNKTSLEDKIRELEGTLEREKRLRTDVEKAKKTTDTELKAAQDQIHNLNNVKEELGSVLKRKQQEIVNMTSRLEDEQTAIAKLNKQNKEIHFRIEGLEEQLEIEHQNKSKVEKAKSDMQREIEDLNDRLEEARGALSVQADQSRKRDLEFTKLRRDMDDTNANYEAQMTTIRKKHNDIVREISEQLDTVTKQKAKVDFDKAQMQAELDDLRATVNSESQVKVNQEKMVKRLELQVSDLEIKCTKQSRHLADLVSREGRAETENTELNRQLEDAKYQLAILGRLKQQTANEIMEAQQHMDDVIRRERTNAMAQVRNLEVEIENLKEQVEGEVEGKVELQRLLSKANAEIQSLRTRDSSDDLTKELEDAKRKLTVRMQDMQTLLEAANHRVFAVEKTRHTMQAEIDHATSEAERVNNYSLALERKQKTLEKQLEEWKRRCDDKDADLEAALTQMRNLNSEVFRHKTTSEELHDSSEALRRENALLSKELKELTSQLGEGERPMMYSLSKMRRTLELEKEELTARRDRFTAFMAHTKIAIPQQQEDK